MPDRSRPRFLPGVAALLGCLAACGAKEDGGPGSSQTDSGTSSVASSTGNSSVASSTGSSSVAPSTGTIGGPCNAALTPTECDNANDPGVQGCVWVPAFEVSVDGAECAYVPAGGACFEISGGGTGCSTTSCGFVTYRADAEQLTVGALGPGGCFLSDGPADWLVQECPDWVDGPPASQEPEDVACHCGCAPGYPA